MHPRAGGPGEVTSQSGWGPGDSSDRLAEVVARLRSRGIRVSVFVDPLPDSIRWAASVGADRVELYTEPYARAFESGEARRSFQVYTEAAVLAKSLGLGVNAGHDLDLDNLVLFRTLPDSMRSRSAMRSCHVRSSQASRPSSASISGSSPGACLSNWNTLLVGRLRRQKHQ